MYSKQFFALVYTPCFLWSLLYTKCVVNLTGQSVTENNTLFRFFSSAITDIASLYNHYGAIIPVPKWMEKQFPNIYRLMTTDPFLAESQENMVQLQRDPDTKFHYYSREQMAPGSGDHMASNIPALVFIVFHSIGFYHKMSQHLDLYNGGDESDVLVCNFKKHLPLMERTTAKAKGDLKEKTKTSWTSGFFPKVSKMKWKDVRSQMLQKMGSDDGKRRSAMKRDNKLKGTLDSAPQYTLLEFARRVFKPKDYNEDHFLKNMDPKFDQRFKNIDAGTLRAAFTNPSTYVGYIFSATKFETLFMLDKDSIPKQVKTRKGVATKKDSQSGRKPPATNAYQFTSKDILLHKKVSSELHSNRQIHSSPKKATAATSETQTSASKTKKSLYFDYTERESVRGCQLMARNYMEKALRCYLLASCAERAYDDEGLPEKIKPTHFQKMNEDRDPILCNLAGSLCEKLENDFQKSITKLMKKVETPFDDTDLSGEDSSDKEVEEKELVTLEECLESALEQGSELLNEMGVDPDNEAHPIFCPNEIKTLTRRSFNDHHEWMEIESLGMKFSANQSNAESGDVKKNDN